SFDYAYLSPINKVRFHTIRGNRLVNNHNYKLAFDDLHEAYLLDEDVNISSYGLYSALAQCLTVFGFANKAIDLLLKAQKLLADSKDKAISIYTNLPLALNYSRIGKYDEALDLLDECLDQNSMASIEPSIYYNYAVVYKAMGDYDKALEHCEIAKNKIKAESSEYLSLLLFMAKIYFASNNLSMMNECLDDGMSISNVDEISEIDFTAFKIMKDKDKYKAAEYLENTAIPYMIEEKRYLSVIEYSIELSTYYEQYNEPVKALEYVKLALSCEQKLSRGNLS
ncbi:MAG: tetratricopeptide repeat protein, partial [Defluviitaleaceae bacterium]|nr:tetratricopeptide repeat protein [Defluviitaleaceae bacterium]